MDQSWTFINPPTLVFLSGSLLTTLLIYLLYRKKFNRAPRELRHLELILSYAGMVGVCLIVLYGIFSRNSFYLLIGIICLPAFLHNVFVKKQSQNEYLGNYACDPEHCGRCGYNLTGNVSGTCSECGWKIPQDPVQYERSDWAFWWKKWKIDYLINWRKKLALTNLWAIAIAALSITTAVGFQYFVISILSAIICINIIINFIRIISYARRQKQ